MKRLSQWPKSLSAVVIWGTVLTTCLIGLTTLIASSKWPFFPALGLGVCATVIRIFWKWQRGPYRNELHDRLASNSIGLYLFLFLAAVVLGAIAAVAPLLVFQQTSDHPCLCLSDQRGRDWLNLMVGGGGGAFLLIGALFVAILALYRLTHWRRVPETETSIIWQQFKQSKLYRLTHRQRVPRE